MSQTTDITLNGAGYMIEPGTPQNPGYRKLQDGYPEGLTQRTSITDFFGGQRRSHQLERDRFYDSLNVGPALEGQGVTPWVVAATRTIQPMNGPVRPDRDVRIPHDTIQDRLYFAVGPTLYQGAIANGGGNNTGIVKTFDHPITDITAFTSNAMLIAFGSAADIVFRTTTGTETALYPGERAHRIQGFSGFAVWIDARAAANPTIIRMSKGGGTGIDSRFTNYDATDLVTVGGELMLITKQALYTFTGRVRPVMRPNPDYNPATPGSPTQVPWQEWVGEFAPFYQQGVYNTADDFTFVTGYGGRTIAWISGGIHEYIPSGERAGWRSTGLSGRRCFGGTVAAGYVVVSIESHSQNNELWAYDGNGWWCIDRQPMTEPTWCWPINIGKTTSAGWDVQVHQHGLEYTRLYRLTPTGTSYAYAPTAQFITPMIDTADRDKLKAWRKVGAVFSSPELQGNTEATGSVGARLEYSTDAGETWDTADLKWPIAGNTLENMNFTLEASLSGVVSRFIQLRVSWSNVTNWAPILTGVWVEHETLHSPARRRKWTLRIHARDQEIDRDGVTLARTGRQLIDELWTAWENDTPMPFTDVDYDADPTTRTVRIVGIQENVAHPADSNKWGDSLITLQLVEV